MSILQPLTNNHKFFQIINCSNISVNILHAQSHKTKELSQHSQPKIENLLYYHQSIPNFPHAKNTDNEKKPFHKAINISKDVKPHTGHIAMMRDIIEITPTTAPTGINFGLYYSSDSMP